MSLNNNLYKFASLKRQTGASVFGIVILLVIVGLFLLSALKVAPSYMDNNVIENTMEGIISNNDFRAMSISEIRAELQRSLVTNNIRDFEGSNVVLTREGNDSYVDINYESRVPLFYNISIVVTFENRFDKN
jgi:hypothetical protein